MPDFFYTARHELLLTLNLFLIGVLSGFGFVHYHTLSGGEGPLPVLL